MTDLMVFPESLEDEVEEKGKWKHEWDTGLARDVLHLKNMLNNREGVREWVVYDIFRMRDDSFTVVWERNYFEPEKEDV